MARMARPATWMIPLALGLILPGGLGGCSAIGELSSISGSKAQPADQASPVRPPRYERVTLPQAVVHVVTIPDPVHYPLRVAVAPQLAPVDQLAAQVCQAEGCMVAAINAGFFDPINGLTTSYVVKDGVVVADPTQNPRLMDNPSLTAYLDQILNRSELRRYDCGGSPQYAISFHRDPAPPGCQVVDAVAAGPQLLPLDTSEVEGFVDLTAVPPRDALGRNSANARSAVGLTADGSLVMVMVAQIPGVSPTGMSLPELATFLSDRGVTQALNLDGGSSSTLVYGGTPYYGRLNQAGEVVQRPVKSILWVGGQ